MHVTNKMFHKDVRLIGMLLRPLTRGTTAEKLRKHREKEKATIAKGLQNPKWGQPKRNDLRRLELKRPDGSVLRAILLTPRYEIRDVPAVLWLHGGGLAVGYPESDLDIMERLMAAADCVMLSPDYTMSFDAPYPAALEDCNTALLWLREHARELGASPDKLFVGGDSGGGGLAAALTIYARDKGEVNIAFQMPLFPMLDDRNNTASARDNDAPMWDLQSNTAAWQLYLGKHWGTDAVPPTAAPARLEDFIGLPPAYSYVGTIEPFYDETRIYFEKLRATGVEATLDTYQGGFHGFDVFAAKKPLGREAREKLYAAFRYAVAHYTSINQ